MSIVGLGTDIVQINRIEEIYQRSGEQFYRRILAEQEIVEFNQLLSKPQANQARFLAKRFAVKESAAKAFGTGFRNGLRYDQIGVTHDDLGKPLLYFEGIAHTWISEMKINNTHLTLSDERDYVVATVIFEQ